MADASAECCASTMNRHVLILGADPGTISLCKSRLESAGIRVASAEVMQPIETSFAWLNRRLWCST